MGSELLLRRYFLGLNDIHLGTGVAKHGGCVDFSLWVALMRD